MALCVCVCMCVCVCTRACVCMCMCMHVCMLVVMCVMAYFCFSVAYAKIFKHAFICCFLTFEVHFTYLWIATFLLVCLFWFIIACSFSFVFCIIIVNSCLLRPTSPSTAVKCRPSLLTLNKRSRLLKMSAWGNFSASPTWSTRPTTGCGTRSTSL